MKNIKKQFLCGVLSCTLVISSILSSTTTNIMAKDIKVTKTVVPEVYASVKYQTKQYAIQDFFIEDNGQNGCNLYTCQNVSDVTGNIPADTCMIKKFEQNGTEGTAKCFDSAHSKTMFITNSGHNQSIEKGLTGDNDFWITCRTGNGTKFTTDIAKVNFLENKIYNFTDLKRLTNVGNINQSKINRIQVALSSDKKKCMVMYSENEKKKKDIMHFSECNASTLNNQLNSLVQAGLNPDLYKSIYPIVKFTFNRTYYANRKSSTFLNLNLYKTDKQNREQYESIQGFELTDAGSTYISSGKKGNNLYIFKQNSKGQSTACVKIDAKKIKPLVNKKSLCEIEGLQLMGSYVYFCIVDHNCKDVMYICRIKKDCF